MMDPSRAAAQVKGAIFSAVEVLWLLGVIAAVVAVILEFGVWEREEVHRGPFAAEGGASSHAVQLRVGETQPVTCCLEPRSDSADNPLRSDLRLWIDDHEMGPAHALHEEIRKGDSAAFNHWGGYVKFSLPAGIENTSSTRATVRYSLRLPAGSVSRLVLMIIVFGLLLHWKRLQALVNGRGTVSKPDLLLIGLGAAGLLSAFIAWETGKNVNLFYLIELSCTYIALLILIHQPCIRFGMLILVLLFVFYSPSPAPSPPMVQEVLTEGRVLLSNTHQSYRFLLTGLAQRQPECGPFQHGDIHIQGEKLTSLKLQTDQGWISQPDIRPFYQESRLRARVNLSGQFPPTELRLVLVNTQQDEAIVRRGAEISGSTIYRDAVYLIFVTDRCVLVFHGRNEN
jgi:hypothetical protein